MLGPLAQVGRSLEPAVRLARTDATVARTWLRNVGAVQQALGGDLARAYGDLLVEASERDPAIARDLALVLPDQLARVAPRQRRRFLVAVGWAVQVRPEVAVTVAQHLAPSLEGLDEDGIRRLILQGAELVGESQAKAASFLRGESGAGQEARAALEPGLPLAGLQRTLSLYAAAHCGESVQVEPAPAGAAEAGLHPLRAAVGGQAWTDGHVIRLPARIAAFQDTRDALLYRVLTALCAGYLEQGSLDLDLAALPGDWPARQPGELDLQRLLRGLGNRGLARDLFFAFEDRRVEAATRRAYPGLARDLDTLRAELPAAPPDLERLRPVDQLAALLAHQAWLGEVPSGAAMRAHGAAWRAFEAAIPALSAMDSPGATVLDAAQALLDLWPAADALLRIGVGPVQPARAAALLRPEARDAAAQAADERTLSARDRAREAGHEVSFSEVRDALAGRRQRADYAEADDWLSTLEGPGGGMVDEPPARGTPELPPTLLQDAEPLAAGGAREAVYPEWDATIGDYRPAWAKVTELPLKRGSGAFVARVMAEYGPQIRSLRRQFEALRPQEMVLERAVPHGDALDFDQVVGAWIERRAGSSPHDRLYLRHHRDRRDVAVAFLLDMSSSTNEVVSGGGKRILEVAKEALVLTAEAVSALGDRFAVWGFSGYGRDQVAFYLAKGFADPWDAAARERVGAMSWKMENRDGAAIRHATQLLLREPARERLLVLLSDGKPLDCGCERYADLYAQEDTHRALQEARRHGVHAFCITVDPHSREYLRPMYGEGGYTIIERVEALPDRLPRIYRRLTR
ncbi:MAG: VWA domain-containing protein [Pseudomonadota bacterium]